MRMLLDDKYDIIDNYMSDSNVGCRRERGIRDHLSIVNRVIHKHCNSKNNPITIQVLDYQSCFDSLWQDKVTSELFDAVVTDDKLALLHRINVNYVCIQTPVGVSDVKTVNKVICQGDPCGGIECGNMIDGFGKDSLKPEMDPYRYKGKVPVPILGMVDGILSISESGYKTCKLNALFNA